MRGGAGRTHFRTILHHEGGRHRNGTGDQPFDRRVSEWAIVAGVRFPGCCVPDHFTDRSQGCCIAEVVTMATQPVHTELRKTGIGVVGDVPWGTHFFMFYETKQDLLDTLVPYFKAGLETGELCLWALS